MTWRLALQSWNQGSSGAYSSFRAHFPSSMNSSWVSKVAILLYYTLKPWSIIIHSLIIRKEIFTFTILKIPSVSERQNIWNYSLTKIKTSLFISNANHNTFKYGPNTNLKKRTRSLCIALSHIHLLIQNRLLVRKKWSSEYPLPFERHPGSIPEPMRVPLGCGSLHINP